MTVKHTTAKTYERNHSDAKVLSVEISGVKNDRLPEKPGKPTEPQTPEEPEKPRYGSLKLTKVDQETGEVLSGAEFVITNEEGEILHSGKTGADGVLLIEQLKPGIYAYREVKAPAGYILNEREYTFCITEEGEALCATVENAMKKKTDVGVEFPIEPKSSEKNAPKTGDGSHFPIYIILLLAGISGILASIRKMK